MNKEKLFDEWFSDVLKAISSFGFFKGVIHQNDFYNDYKNGKTPEEAANDFVESYNW